MASPIAAGKVGGAQKVAKNKGMNNKSVEGEEASRFRLKLKSWLSCMDLSCKAIRSKRNKNKRDDDKVIEPVARASSRNNNSRTSRSPSPTCEINYYSHLKQFTFHELRLATRNFRRDYFLGEGGFGSVFKGWISHNGTSPSGPGLGLPVAVKTLNTEGNQGHKEWVAEVNHLGALQHPNLVKLVGYCIEDEHRLLVYEFMPRGSLENHLFKRVALPLPWAIRLKIILGAAKGLAFLHEEAKKPLIYRDFKTSNILLDLEYNAKLSDFGLARDAPDGDFSHVSTQVMGTEGYAAPEYVMTGRLTLKSDVYGFGVVFLEILTGKRALDKRRPHKEQFLVQWAKPFMKHGCAGFNQLMDRRLEGQYSPKAAYKALRVIAHCLCREQKERPSMSEVVHVLESLLDYNDIPSSPSPPLPLPSWYVGSSPSSTNGTNKHGHKIGSSTTSSSRSTPNRFKASPLSLTPPLLSPGPSGG